MANPTFLYPVGNVDVSQPFIPGKHYGIDFAVPVGTNVHASRDGKITYRTDEEGGYGNIFHILHDGGYETWYAHLSQFLKNIGDEVKSGDVIGLSGGAAQAAGAGNSKGPHLHFEIHQNGIAIDPASLLSGVSTSSADSSGGGSGLDAAFGFFSALTKGSTWIRVGEIIGALILFYFAYKLYNDELNFSLPGSN